MLLLLTATSGCCWAILGSHTGRPSAVPTLPASRTLTLSAMFPRIPSARALIVTAVIVPILQISQTDTCMFLLALA